MAPGHASRASCVLCGADTDPLRDPVRYVEGRVHSVCSACASGAQAGAPTDEAPEPAPQSPAALPAVSSIPEPTRVDSELTEEPSSPVAPAVLAHELAPEPQPAVRSADIPVATRESGEPEAPVRPRWPLYAGSVAALALLVALGSQKLRSCAQPSSAASAASAATSESSESDASTRANPLAANPSAAGAPATAATADEAGVEHARPPPDSAPIADSSAESAAPAEPGATSPALRDWIYPVLGSEETFPLKKSRRFGAKREGKRVRKCGRGHCGADLDGTRGAPVVAVVEGEVVRIERNSKKTSGRYVRLRHAGDVFTSYMHLDRIAEGLRVGDRVRAGAPVGTLGRTGIKTSPAHLHLSLEVPIEGGTRHIDPVPLLMTATRLPNPQEQRDQTAVARD